MAEGAGSLSLVCGMACAGKTTLARRLERETAALRFSPDEWIASMLADPEDRHEMDRLRVPMEELQWHLAQRLLSSGLDVILENGFWRREERIGYCMTARAMGARVFLHYLDVSREELLRRVEARNANLPKGSFRIYPGEIDTWLGWFEPPDEAEYVRYDDVHIHRPEART